MESMCASDPPPAPISIMSATDILSGMPEPRPNAERALLQTRMLGLASRFR